jgi:hypothetical protein
VIGLLATEASSRANFVSLDVPSWAWVALLGAITILLVADLLIVHRTPHEVSIKAALIESSVWIALGGPASRCRRRWSAGREAASVTDGG